MSSAATTAAQSTTSAQSTADWAPAAADSRATAAGTVSSGSGGVPPEDGTARVATDYSSYRVVAAKHPWRWVGAAIGLILLAQFVNGLITNPGWDWPTFARYITAPVVLQAVWLTIQLTVYGTVLGFALGIAIAAGRLSKNPVLQTISWTYVWAFRSIPLIVQLLFWFNIAYLYQSVSIGVPFGPSFVTFDVNSTISGIAAAA